MEKKELIHEQLEDIHKLLKENNFLLREIAKQNQLIAEITVETVWHYSPYHYWPESTKIKQKREELKNLYDTIHRKLRLQSP